MNPVRSSLSHPVSRTLLRWNGTLAVAAGLLLSGCAGYTLGPTNGLAPGARSVHIGPVSNSTDEPRLADAVNQALRAQVQSDATFRLSRSDESDIVVTTAILQFVRNPLTFQRGDIVSTRDYEVVLTAHVKAIERGGGRTLIDREVTGRTTIRGNVDLGSAERQAAPLLAESLARNIVTLLSEGTW